MLRIAFIAFAVVIGVSVGGHAQQPHPAPLPSGWRALSGTEIQTLMQAHKLGGINPLGQPFLSEYGNGTLTTKARTPSGGMAIDTGRWEIEGDRACVKMGFFLNGQRSCGGMATDGRGHYQRIEPDIALSRFPPEVYLDAVPLPDGTRWTTQ